MKAILIAAVFLSLPIVCYAQDKGARDTSKYYFKEHYAAHSIPLWEVMLNSYKGKPNLRYLEIGVGEGESTIWMLGHVLTHPSARMTGIDIFPGDLKKRFLSNVRISGFASKVKVITGRSQVELRRLPLDSFDIIYVDGSHFAPDVLTDAVLSWQLLKEDGLLIFDDYLMAVGQPGPDGQRRDTVPLEFSPKVAIDAFITAHRNNLEVLYRDYQVFLKKRKESRSLSLGEYRYSWGAKKLYRAGNKEIIPLSQAEQKLIERLFLSRPFGETSFRPDAELLGDRNFIELKKRLNLDLGE